MLQLLKTSRHQIETAFLEAVDAQWTMPYRPLEEGAALLIWFPSRHVVLAIPRRTAEQVLASRLRNQQYIQPNTTGIQISRCEYEQVTPAIKYLRPRFLRGCHAGTL